MHRSLWTGIIIGVITILSFHYSLLFNLMKPLELSQNDAYLHMFIMKHSMDVFLSGNLSQNPAIPMWYGSVEYPLYFVDYFLTPMIFGLPLYIVSHNIFLTFNALVLLSIVSAFIGMYLLAWHFTKKYFPSLIAGLIFVLNPFLLARFPSHFNLISIQWIPLIFLSFELYLSDRKNRYLFLVFVFLILQLLTSLYYFGFLSVLLPIYCGVRIWQTKTPLKAFLTFQSIIGGVLLLASLGGVYMYYARHLPGPETLSFQLRAGTVRYSAWLSDWFLAPQNNLLFGKSREALQSISSSLVSGTEWHEHSLFPGIIALTLLIASMFSIRRHSLRKELPLFVGLFIFCFVLSLGPTISITNTLKLPGVIYSLFSLIDPLFTYMRVPARIAIFGMFFLSLIAALVLTSLTEKFKNSQYRIIGAAIIFCILLLEYWSQPLNFFTPSNQDVSALQELRDDTTITAVMHYPTGNIIPFESPASRSEELDTHYMFWSFYHGKKIFNGYGSFPPTDYFARSELISLYFPNEELLEAIKSIGIGAIIIHKDEMKKPEQYVSVVQAVKSFDVPIKSSTDTITVFDLAAWQPKASVQK